MKPGDPALLAVVQRLIVDVGVADKKVLLEIHLASPLIRILTLPPRLAAVNSVTSARRVECRLSCPCRETCCRPLGIEPRLHARGRVDGVARVRDEDARHAAFPLPAPISPLRCFARKFRQAYRDARASPTGFIDAMLRDWFFSSLAWPPSPSAPRGKTLTAPSWRHRNVAPLGGNFMRRTEAKGSLRASITLARNVQYFTYRSDSAACPRRLA
jgi:hypothetical protein